MAYPLPLGEGDEVVDAVADHPGGIVRVGVTRRQARLMAEAVWRLEQEADRYAEIAHIQVYRTVRDREMLADLRRRLYTAASTP